MQCSRRQGDYFKQKRPQKDARWVGYKMKSLPKNWDEVTDCEKNR